MVSQKQSGKAFEYAVVSALQKVIGENNVDVINDHCLEIALSDFSSLAQENQKANLIAAIPAIEFLLGAEPNLRLCCEGKKRLQVSLQSDQAGEAGDVRDVLIAIPNDNWEIGISAKHQHEALKHSRLSRKIDFGSKWLGVPCSETYFTSISSIFDYLAELKAQNISWSQLPKKDSEVYIPILQAFKKELLSLEEQIPGTVAQNLVSYLIGHKDFYKVIKLKNQTKIQVFNFNGTLNTAVQGIQPVIKINRFKLPSRVVELDFKRIESSISTTTLDMICDAGWQISFRLHNASTKVETSLKFDINLVGHPNNLQTFSLPWED